MKFLRDRIENPHPDLRIRHQRSVVGGDLHVGLQQRQLCIVDRRLEKHPVLVHHAQQRRLRRPPPRELFQRAPQSVPARKNEAALHPGKDPRDRAEVLDRFGRLAKRRTRSELQPANLLDRRGRAPELDELGVLVHERVIGVVSQFRHLRHRRAPRLRDPRLLLGRLGTEENAVGHLLDDAKSEIGIVIAGRKNLALFRHANLRVVATAGLRQDRLGRRAAAARDAAAASMKKRQPQRAGTADDGNRFLGLEKRPVGGQVAAVLVAVGVTEHHHLVIAPGTEMFPVGLAIEHLFEDDRGGLEIAQRFKKRRDVEGDADEMRKDQDFQNVGEIVGHADDIGADRLRAIKFNRPFQDAQRADDVPGFGRERVGQRGRGTGEHADEQGQALFFRQRGIIGREVEGKENFLHRAFVPPRVLAHIEPGDAQAKERHLLAEPVQFPLGQQGGAIRGEALADEIEQFADFPGFERRNRTGGGIEQIMGAFAFLRLKNPGAQSGQGQPVGLVRITVAQGPDMGIKLAPGLEQSGQLGRNAVKPRGNRKLPGKFAQGSLDFIKREPPMKHQRFRRHHRGDIRVAVPVAAHPGTERDPAGGRLHRRIGVGQGALELVLQKRHRLPEGRVEIPEPGADFVRHFGPGRPGTVGEPERSDLPFQRPGILDARDLVLDQRFRIVQPLRQPLQFIEHRAPFRLRRVRGENQFDRKLVEEFLHRRRRDVPGLQFPQRRADRLPHRRRLHRDRLRAPPLAQQPDPVRLLRQIHQLEIDGESHRHPRRLGNGQFPDHGLKLALGARVTQTAALGQQPKPLFQIVDRLALKLDDDLPQDAAQFPDFS